MFRKPGKAYNVEVGMMKPLSLIVAVDEQGGFGKDGKIPWNFPDDLKHFQNITKNAGCIMGRKTYTDMYDMAVARQSKGRKSERVKPVRIKNILPNRESYVISRTIKAVQGATVVSSIRAAVEATTKPRMFIIGGENIYIEALPWVNTIYLTQVDGIYDCDKFFPIDYIQSHFIAISGKKVNSLRFITYRRNK